MECLSAVSKHKSWLYSLLILILMVCQTQVGCIEEERKALLEIKASLYDSYVVDVDHDLPTWVDDGNTSGDCCHWERVKCNTTTRRVTHLSLSDMMRKVPWWPGCERMWPLNVSLFLHFKELKSLNLSSDCLDDRIVRTGLGRLSSLKKLEILDLNDNFITNETFPSLGALTSLRVLNLGYNELEGYFPALALENLEILDLSWNYNMEGFERVSMLKKFKILDLGLNKFNESLMTSLSALPSLKALNLDFNNLQGPFPAQELAHLTNLEELILTYNQLNDTPSIQDCNKLSRLKKLESISLGGNDFNKSIISCLSALPSLKTLDLSSTRSMGCSFPIQELSSMPDLEVLILRFNDFNGTLPMEGFASFHHLEVLDLTWNKFGSIPSTIRALSSLRVVSFASNMLNGSLNHGLCELKNLHELDISYNMLDGSVPQCFNNLSSLKLLDISSNRFTGTLKPSPIANLTSLEYVDFGNNKFDGSFSFSSFSSHTRLEVVRFVCEVDKFELETDEPLGWTPLFQLKVLVLSSCNMNRRVVPGFLLHQRKLQVLDLSNNSLVGPFPSWLIGNNTMLKGLDLRSNSFGGNIRMPLYMNANIRWLDVSDNSVNGTIPADIQNFLPNITNLNLSSNSLDGIIPSSLGGLSQLQELDLSDNELSGEVPNGLFTNLINLDILRLSNNRLHGQVLSGNSSFGNIWKLHLDSNCFTGKIGNGTSSSLEVLDISNNYFIGAIPHWMSSNGLLSELVVRNNSLEGQFPCGTTSFSFLDISQNSFSGSIPACLNLRKTKHLYLDSNRFTGSVPNAFRNLTDVLTLDIGNNFLSGRIPGFLGELSNLKILILRKNNFSGSIPKQLCQLRNVSLIDLSSNSLRGSIPRCLQNIIIPVYPTPIESRHAELRSSFYNYVGVLQKEMTPFLFWVRLVEIKDEVQFTTKKLSLLYKGRNLDLMVGLDLSCNKLVGEIPEELGLLTQIHSLNLSHNQLFGPIPMQFSNLANIESLDLSSNRLSGEVPSELIQLHYLSDFNVSHNNLSGRLPDMKGQFGTFTKESYEGNQLLCGPPLEIKCTTASHVNDPSTNESNDKCYDIDMASFYGSSGSTCIIFLLGFAAVLYINPYWRRRWLDLVEECMYTCYYFLEDSVRKLRMFFCK